jgi:hypothetical protein
MTRVCGAEREAPRAAQLACWCRGMFCGKGGAKLSTQFRRELRNRATAASRAQFRELTQQLDLYAGPATSELWEGRLDAHIGGAERRRRATKGAA